MDQILVISQPSTFLPLPDKKEVIHKFKNLIFFHNIIPLFDADILNAEINIFCSVLWVILRIKRSNPR